MGRQVPPAKERIAIIIESNSELIELRPGVSRTWREGLILHGFDLDKTEGCSLFRQLEDFSLQRVRFDELITPGFYHWKVDH